MGASGRRVLRVAVGRTEGIVVAPPTTRSASVPRLRAWQRAALEDYDTVARRRDYLVTATPGAGKTAFALALAARLLERRGVDRLIVVCPTDHLRTQWAEAAHRLGIELDPALTNAGPLRPGLHGYVSTYAQVAARPAMHAARCRTARTLVVLDEVHHAGDGLSWGDAVAEAFEEATRRLSLTGTPFRTRPDERIPFVRYEPDADGGWISHADFTYGYRQALVDGVVRPVVFAAYTGTSRWRNSAGEVLSVSLSERATRTTEQQAWRTALNPRGRWVPHVIAAMDERIAHQRASGVPDAAGLVLASDQDDARDYAEIVERVTGRPPVLIVSDDPKAGEKIAAFAAGEGRIAVCVRMVSEGVDIPRATCLAWMTSYRTPLFFAQGVGRVVRSRSSAETATVFLPAVRPLLTLAAELETERNHVIPAPPEGENGLDVVREPAEPGGAETIEHLDADAAFAHVLHAGRAVVAEPESVSVEDEDFLGLPGLLTPEQTAALLARRDRDVRRRADSAAGGPRADVAGAGADPEARRSDLAVWRASASLRKDVNRLVSILSARQGRPHGQIHSELRRAVPGPASAAASTEVLEARRDYLMELLGTG